MEAVKLLLNAYYEQLHELLEGNRKLLTASIDRLLTEEIKKQDFGDFDNDKYEAYREACLAFVDERIETYNPIGIQYTFDYSRRQSAFELELQLDWYDSRAEFERLLEAARARSKTEITEQTLKQLTNDLIKEAGAFPDRSIISAYEAEPAEGKLPDYVVARAIEEIAR